MQADIFNICNYCQYIQRELRKADIFFQIWKQSFKRKKNFFFFSNLNLTLNFWKSVTKEKKIFFSLTKLIFLVIDATKKKTPLKRKKS